MDLEALLEGVRAEAGDVPLIGCSGDPLFTGTAAAGPAVVVSALGGDGFEVATTVALNVSDGQRAAGVHVAEPVATLTREHQVLLMLCDGLAGTGTRSCGAPTAWSARASRWSAGAPPTTWPWSRRSSSTPTTTASTSSATRLSPRRSVRTRRSGSGSRTGGTGSFACVDDAFDEALAPLDDARSLGFLGFDGIARHAVIGADGIAGELDRLVDRAAGTPLAGFVTYGELARIRGSEECTS